MKFFFTSGIKKEINKIYKIIKKVKKKAEKLNT